MQKKGKKQRKIEKNSKESFYSEPIFPPLLQAELKK